MPLHGSKPSQATPTPCSPLRQCRSRCVAGSGSNSRSHLVAVEPAILMLLRALELASWPGGPKLVERAWCKVEGHVVPQPWLVNTTAPGIAPDDRRRLDLVVYGWCTLLRSDPRLASHARWRAPPRSGRAGWSGSTYPELATGGAQALCVLGCEVSGRWNADAVKLVQRL